MDIPNFFNFSAKPKLQNWIKIVPFFCEAVANIACWSNWVYLY